MLTLEQGKAQAYGYYTQLPSSSNLIFCCKHLGGLGGSPNHSLNMEKE